MTPNAMEWLTANGYGRLSVNNVLALFVVCNMDEFSRKSLREVTGWGYEDVEKAVISLSNNGMLVRTGAPEKGKQRYKVIESIKNPLLDLIR